MPLLRHRITFPLYNAEGHLVAISGRTLGYKLAKYVVANYEPEISFCAIPHQPRDKKEIVLVEGSFDATALLQNCVVTPGHENESIVVFGYMRVSKNQMAFLHQKSFSILAGN